jgi:transposase-like protein
VGISFGTNFTFGFMSPWQKNLLAQSHFVCLDATYKTSNLRRYLLYTIVVRHPVTGTGCCVAYMFTTDNGASPVKRFMISLRANGVTNLQKITIDVSNVELDAISTVYPEVQVQWCLFHVARAWMSKIREHIEVGSSHDNGLEQGRIMAHLKSMM